MKGEWCSAQVAGVITAVKDEGRQEQRDTKDRSVSRSQLQGVEMSPADRQTDTTGEGREEARRETERWKESSDGDTSNAGLGPGCRETHSF